MPCKGLCGPHHFHHASINRARGTSLCITATDVFQPSPLWLKSGRPKMPLNNLMHRANVTLTCRNVDLHTHRRWTVLEKDSHGPCPRRSRCWSRGGEQGSTSPGDFRALVQVDTQAAGTLAAQLGADPVLMPETGSRAWKIPGVWAVAQGPCPLLQVILCSGKTKVAALEEQSNPSCGPASFPGEEAGKSQVKSGPVGKQGWSVAGKTNGSFAIPGFPSQQQRPMYRTWCHSDPPLPTAPRASRLIQA